MTRTKKAAPDMVWWVAHPDHTIAIVSAPNWEQATVEAAKWWGVPWRKVAALCECQRKERITRNVCAICGTIFHGKDLLCTRCQIVERDKELNRRARDKRYYRGMMQCAAGQRGKHE